MREYFYEQGTSLRFLKYLTSVGPLSYRQYSYKKTCIWISRYFIFSKKRSLNGCCLSLTVQKKILCWLEFTPRVTGYFLNFRPSGVTELRLRISSDLPRAQNDAKLLQIIGFHIISWPWYAGN